ncbi:HisJ ABC-type amino acid transport/signal transduction systems, periplasmic component/domain [Comamonadaceae bacterium]
MAHITSSCRRTALGLIVFCLSTLHCAVGAQAIRFAPEKDYAPFISAGPAGKVQGLSMDVLDILKPRLGADVQVLPPDNLANILLAARRGEVDLISSLRPTPERAEFLAFTEPYVKVPAVLVVKQGPVPPTLKDLVGRSVAVGKGYAVESFVRANYPQVRWVALPDDVTALQSLMRGEVDGVVADVASVSDATRHSGIRGVQVVESLPFEYELSFAYRKELPALGEALNAGLKEITPATRQALIRRWIDTSTLTYEDPRLTWVRKLAMVLSVLALVMVGVWRLRSKRTSDRGADGL